MSSKSKKSDPEKSKVVYREFGEEPDVNEAIARPETPPTQQNLRVQLSRKGRGGKSVTVITGFDLSEDALAALAKQIKSQCGTGGTVKEETIEIQGDRREQIFGILIKLGYKAKISGG
jgi:translation initiation factor 1